MSAPGQPADVAAATSTSNTVRTTGWPPTLTRGIASACLLSAVGGLLDAWIYIGHGGVFANAQTGNIMLGAIAFATGRFEVAFKHLPPLLAFCSGILMSRWAAARLTALGTNARTARLLAEALALSLLAVYARHFSNEVVTAAVGFLAAWQITTFASIRGWSFNTGMTTGNLVSALSAARVASAHPEDIDARHQAIALGLMCGAFVVGATAGTAMTRLAGDSASCVAAATVLAAAAIARDLPD